MRTPHAYTHITFFERSLACEKLLTCCNPAPTAMLLLPANKKENRTFVAIGLLSRKRPGLKKKGRLTQRGVIEEISRYLGILYEFRVHVSCFLAPAFRTPAFRTSAFTKTSLDLWRSSFRSSFRSSTRLGNARPALSSSHDHPRVRWTSARAYHIETLNLSYWREQ
jgi:hypothetical protein